MMASAYVYPSSPAPFSTYTTSNSSNHQTQTQSNNNSSNSNYAVPHSPPALITNTTTSTSSNSTSNITSTVTPSSSSSSSMSIHAPTPIYHPSFPSPVTVSVSSLPPSLSYLSSAAVAVSPPFTHTQATPATTVAVAQTGSSAHPHLSHPVTQQFPDYTGRLASPPWSGNPAKIASAHLAAQQAQQQVQSHTNTRMQMPPLPQLPALPTTLQALASLPINANTMNLHNNNHPLSSYSHPFNPLNLDSAKLLSPGLQSLVAASHPSIQGSTITEDDDSISAQKRKMAIMSHTSNGTTKSQRKVACVFCHQAKTVCIGGRPCQRCNRLGKATQCVDRVTTNKKIKKGEGGGGGGGSVERVRDKSGKESITIKNESRTQHPMTDTSTAAPALTSFIIRPNSSILQNGQPSLSPLSMNALPTTAGTSSSLVYPIPMLPTSPSPPSPPTGTTDSSYLVRLLSAFAQSAIFQAVLHRDSGRSTTNHALLQTSLYLLAYFNHELPRHLFKEFITFMGYSPSKQSSAQTEQYTTAQTKQDTSNRTQENESAAVHALQPLTNTLPLRAESPARPTMYNGTAATSPATVTTTTIPAAETSITATNSDETPVVWRSSYAHLPDVTIPFSTRFVWNSGAPEQALQERTLTTRFPSLIIQRGNVDLTAYHTAVQAANTSTTTAAIAPRLNVSDFDYPCMVIVNTEFEHLFGYTQQEIRSWFMRDYREPLQRLTVEQMEFGLAHVIKAVMEGKVEDNDIVWIKTKYGNTARALRQRNTTVDGSVWFTRIVFTYIPLTK